MDLNRASPTDWLPDEHWKRIQGSMPIICVDVLPIQQDDKEIRTVGLIKRHTPHQGIRWCLIGGRLRFKEKLRQAVERELQLALGCDVSYSILANDEPCRVIEYLPIQETNGYFDPRQHAISLTYAVLLSGTPSPQGEALDFKWFPAEDIADMPSSIGFGQLELILECVSKLQKAAPLEG
jgi:ADP-ribose pyrophosphatase YjhB (NUDIX family)